MEFRPIERGPQAFQQTVTSEQIWAVCRRVFGADVRVISAIELGNGMYNNTYRIDIGAHRPVILRVAPEPQRQFSSERELMRAEYASVPYLTAIAPLMPRVITADFTGEVIERDYLFQTLLEGVPAPEHLGRYERSTWSSFFRQMGTIARDIHSIRGNHFGRVTGPNFRTWSEALLDSFDDIAQDTDAAGLDSADIRKVCSHTGHHHRAILDEIVEPRMLSGDLWTANVMLAKDATEPAITGVLDLDRTLWGAPAADWTIRMAALKPGTERDAFWESYGTRDVSPQAMTRSWIYEARHIGAIRLERYRLGQADGVRETYADMAVVLGKLTRHS